MYPSTTVDTAGMQSLRRALSVATAFACLVVLTAGSPGSASTATPGNSFTDDDGNIHEDSIEAIRSAGITTGCAPARYCPNEPVTRGQMAAFLNRALDLPAATTASGFTDTAGTFHDDIERLKHAGITTGCAPDRYCTDRAVTRGEMATFLVRALDLADGECCGEGSVDVLAVAKTSFNGFTSGGYWSAINEHYDRLRVYVPYWHSRLAEFDQVFAYRVSYGMSVDPDKDTRPIEHPDWVLRDGDGDPTYIDFRCSTGCVRYAADIGNPEFIADTIAWAQDLRDRGYPGIMLDDVNFAWRISDEFGDPVYPIDPRTGEPLTLTTWQRYFAEFLEAIRAAVPDMEIMHNVIWYADAPTMDNPYVDRQIAAADYLQLERGANDKGLVGGDGKFSMGNFFAFVDRAHELGANVLLLDENAVDEVGQEYNLAAALLLNDGNDLVSTEDHDFIDPDNFWSGFDTDLGDALGPREVDGTITRRDFTGGLVLFNDPQAPTVTITLDSPMRNLAGDVVETVTLGSREAAILSTP